MGKEDEGSIRTNEGVEGVGRKGTKHPGGGNSLPETLRQEEAF